MREIILEKIKSPKYKLNDYVEVYINKFGREYYKDLLGEKIVSDHLNLNMSLAMRGFVKMYPEMNHINTPHPGELFVNMRTGELKIYIGGYDFVSLA